MSGIITMVLAAACSKQDPYVPPDLFYYFASYKVGKNPTTITAIDINQDGVTDLMTTNVSSNTLSILIGNGDGSFHEQVQLHVCQEPRSLATGFFNADAYLDIVLACAGGDQIAVLFGSGDGKFTEGPQYPVHRTPVAIASDDLNGDHIADLVVALRNDKIKVFLGQGNGEFRHGAQYEYGDTPTSVALSDLNGDGKIDLVVTNGGPMSNAVSIWIGNGDGTFQSPTDYRSGRRPLGVSFADFNNDHVRDLLVINGERDSFSTFLGNGMRRSRQAAIPEPTPDPTMAWPGTLTATIAPMSPSSICSPTISRSSSAEETAPSSIRRGIIAQSGTLRYRAISGDEQQRSRSLALSPPIMATGRCRFFFIEGSKGYRLRRPAPLRRKNPGSPCSLAAVERANKLSA